MKQFSPALAGGALCLILALSASAQPARRGWGNGPRGDGPPPGEMRRGPRAKGELNRVWRDIAALEGSKLALSRAQSAKVVALVAPVSKKQTLSNADAKSLATKITAVLSSAQRAQLEKERPRGPMGGPMGGPRGERPPGGPPGGSPIGPPRGDKDGPRGDGPPRMNRAEFEKVRPFMDALNPFYPPTGYAKFKTLPTGFAKDVAKRYGERRALLETLSRRAKGK